MDRRHSLKPEKTNLFPEPGSEQGVKIMSKLRALFSNVRPGGKNKPEWTTHTEFITDPKTPLSIVLWNLSRGDEKISSEERLKTIEFVLWAAMRENNSNVFFFCQDQIQGTKKDPFLRTIGGWDHNLEAQIFHYSNDFDVGYIPLDSLREFYNKVYEIDLFDGGHRPFQAMLERMFVCVLIPKAESQKESQKGKILLVSWHGPPDGINDGKRKFFMQLLEYLENLRKYEDIKCEYVIVGGNFNMDVSEATNMVAQIEGIEKPHIAYDYVLPGDRDKPVLNYLISWPVESRNQIDSTLFQPYPWNLGVLEPFDHPIVMCHVTLPIWRVVNPDSEDLDDSQGFFEVFEAKRAFSAAKAAYVFTTSERMTYEEAGNILTRLPKHKFFQAKAKGIWADGQGRPQIHDMPDKENLMVCRHSRPRLLMHFDDRCRKEHTGSELAMVTIAYGLFTLDGYLSTA